METLLIVILSFLILLWLIGFLIRTDFSIPNANISRINNVLVIFPHPDDEVLTVGGLMQMKKTTLHVLTKGERGMPDASLNGSLKKIRSDELKHVSKLLSVDKLIHDDFGDGALKKKKKELTKRINEIIQSENPDLVITNDLSGLYGHEDHIVCSDIVTKLIKNTYPYIKLWYATNPSRILKLMHLPEHMAKDPVFKARRMTPTVKLSIGLNIIQKIKAVYAYKSQYESFRSAFPVGFIPLWFPLSMSLHEYFHEAN